MDILKRFSDALVRDPRVVALRDRVTAAVDPAIGEEQVRAIVTLKDGPWLMELCWNIEKLGAAAEVAQAAAV